MAIRFVGFPARPGGALRLVGLALAVTFVGCDGTAGQGPSLSIGDLPATISLTVGESRRVGSSEVRFDAVASDSRCATDVTCVWAGNAALAIAVGPAAGDGPETSLTLNTDLEPRSGAARGLVLAIVGLSPEPVSTKPTTGYEVEIRVERSP